MKKLLIALLLTVTPFCFGEVAPSVDVFITKSAKKINYVYQGNKKDVSQIKKLFKALSNVQGVTVIMHIDSKLELSELHKQLKTLKEAGIKSIKVIINEKDGKTVVIPIKTKSLDFDFVEIMLEDKE